MTEEKKGAERRERLRILVRVLVDCDSHDTYLYDYSNNLSEGGIFIETDKPFVVGTTLTLRFSLPNIDRVFETQGEVRWISEASSGQIGSDGHRLPRGMGVQFTEMTDEDQTKLQAYIGQVAEEQGADA